MKFLSRQRKPSRVAPVCVTSDSSAWENCSFKTSRNGNILVRHRILATLQTFALNTDCLRRGYSHPNDCWHIENLKRELQNHEAAYMKICTKPFR